MSTDFTCPGRSMPQPADAPLEGYVACYRAGHTCTSTVTRTEDERGVATWVHCPCCGNSFSSMYVPASMVWDDTDEPHEPSAAPGNFTILYLLGVSR